MKKFGMMMCGIALMATCFMGCEKKENGGNGGGSDLDNIVENGFYVAIGDKMELKYAFAQGLNEVDKSAREGMYEKYLILEANQEFSFINKEGQNQAAYGAELTFGELATDGNDAVNGYKGFLKEGVKMSVKETGFYHIILDFNKDGKLDAVGGAQIVIMPVEFGVRGTMNGWGFTKAASSTEIKAGVETITWTWTNIDIAADGKFKFAHNNCWKVNLDDAEQVKANSNLGTNGEPNGADIPVAEGGLYTITLTWTLKQGDIKDGFIYSFERTGDRQIKDYSNYEMELVGAAVADQEGASVDASSWSWGNVFPMGKPEKNGDVYTWSAKGVKLVAGEFKVRSVGALEQDGIASMDNGENLSVSVDGEYNVTFVYDAANDTKEATVVLAGDAPKTVKGTIQFDIDEAFAAGDALYVYSWIDGTSTNMFGSWPGTALEGNTIEYEAVEGAAYRFIINNNNGHQTPDSDPITLVGQDIYVTVDAEGNISVSDDL